MQSLILLFILFSTSVFAKTDWCKFDSDFSQKYMEARNKYANNIKNKKHHWKTADEYSYGYERQKKFSNKWESVSMRDQIQRQFGTTEVEYVVKENGKMLIYPKGMTEAKPAIIFDPSGDYFRVVKTKIKNGKVEDLNVYYNKANQQIQRPKGLTDAQWDEIEMASTHFKANP